MKEIRIELEGLGLAALESGPADAPVLLALHGWLDNGASFSPLSAHLADHRLIALDLPGHGHSEHLPQNPLVHYNFADSIPAVLAVADALGLQSFDLLGHSMGAGVASLVAPAAPNRVRRLALVEGLAPLPDSPDSTLPRFRDAVSPRLDPGPPRLRAFPHIDTAAEARSRASGLPANLVRPIIERALVEVEGGYRWRSDPRLTEASLLRLTEGQVRRLLAGIRCPTWLLLAEPETPYLPGAMMQARAASVADIRTEHLAGHHHLQLEHPAQVAMRLETFLR